MIGLVYLFEILKVWLNMTTEEKFNAAVNVIKGLPKDGPYQPSNEMKLLFYGLYKQATEGPCRDPKPAFYQVVSGYKWNAWNSLGEMSKTDAMETYVTELKKIVETMSYSADVATFMEVLGSFYEYVDVPASTNNNITVQQKNSSLKQTCDDNEPIPKAQNDNPLPISTRDNYDVHAAILQPQTKLTDDSFDLNMQERVLPISKIDEPCMANGNVTNGAIPSHLNSSPQLTAEHSDDHKAESIMPHEQTPVLQQSDEGDADVVTRDSSVIRHNRLQSETDSEEEYSEPSESLVYLSPDVADNVSSLGERPSGVLPSASTAAYYQTSMKINGDRSHVLSSSSGIIMPPSCDGVTSREGPGTTGGDNMVVVLRQMQGDLQAMVQCLQAHLNEISQCLVALHRTTQALQAHSGGGGSNGGGSNGGGGHHSPQGADCSRRRHRQWWPFPELSPRSTFWLLLWPVLLHVGSNALKMLVKFRRRGRLLPK